MTQKTIVLTTGGSGGHIFPAQSVAAELLKRDYKVVFITDRRGNAFQNLPEVETYRLMADSVTGRSILGKIFAIFKLWFGSVQAMKLLFNLRPDLVIGFGGYASIPTVLSAHMMKIPVVLHEQNAILGRANRVCAKKSRLIATSFAHVERIPKDVPAIHVGQPVRQPILEKKNSSFQLSDDFNLLIFGGSQGARFFSERLPKVLMDLPLEYRRRLVLTQQVRPEDEDMVREAYQNAEFKQLLLAPFFKNMPELFEQANLVIGRGGAGTLTEVMVVGRPAFIIPLPSAADNHQAANAKALADASAGWVLEQKDFNGEKMTEQIKSLMDNPDVLSEMGKKAYDMAIINAAERMVDIVDDIVQGAAHDV